MSKKEKEHKLVLEKSLVPEQPIREPIIQITKLSAGFGQTTAVKEITLPIPKSTVTAIIGPSGCGKSTLLRSLNRMHELTANSWVDGEVLFQGDNIYTGSLDPIEIRRRIGMVFQRPNPFPKSIYDNVAFGARMLGVADKEALDELVQTSLKQAYLWDEVKNDYKKKSGTQLSGGQQQRLCIARALAVQPEVLLMDEPCSSLDPLATAKIEDLMRELSVLGYTIVVVTHNLPQALRVSEYTGFLNSRHHDGDRDIRWGELVEFGTTADVFYNPKSTETLDYITGKFG